MYQETSQEAYNLLVEQPGQLSAKQQAVLNVFTKLVKNQPLSNFDIATMLDWPINCVTPRVLELRENGSLVHVGYKRQLETDKRVMLWMLPEVWDGNMVNFDYKGFKVRQRKTKA